MAIIRLGPIVSAISGTVGSVVFIAGGRSTVARLRPVTLFKTSPFLARSKVRMQNLQRHWSTLTTLQKDAWQTAANDINQTNSLGQASPMNGFQFFIMTNKVVFPAVFSILEEPAVLQPFDVVDSPAVSFSAAGAYDVQIANPIAPFFLRLQVYGWPFWRTTISKEVARLVFIAELNAFSDPVVLNVRTAWLEHFGPLQEGQRFAVGIKARTGSSPFNHMSVLRDTVGA